MRNFVPPHDGGNILVNWLLGRPDKLVVVDNERVSVGRR